MHSHVLLSTVALILIQGSAAVNQACPILGALYPQPTNLNSDKTWQAFASELSANWTQYAKDNKTPYGPLSGNDTSFSLHIASTDSDQPLFDFHWTADIHESYGTSKVDADTVYRVGSVSKLFIVYAWLLHAGGTDVFADYITKYLPQLKNSSSGNDLDQVKWDEVTVGALASQMSGLGRDYAFTDLTIQKDLGIDASILGLPDVTAADIPVCSSFLQNCTADQYLADLNRRHPTFPTFYSPTYSNAAFDVLGIALTAATGKSFEQNLYDLYFKALNMSRSSVTTPDATTGIIPNNVTAWWDKDIGFENPAGGVYSSSTDLAKLGKAILSNAQLSPRDVRRWLKPLTHTSSLYTSVGAPWEIIRYQNPEIPYQIIDLYTKGGDIGDYHTWILLIEEYNVVFTILVAGNSEVQAVAKQTLFAALMPALNNVARQQAADNFVGSYVAKGNNGTNSSITFTMDDGPGLVVSELISNGTDALAALAEIGFTLPSAGPVRLYPSALRSNDSSESSKGVVERLGFRMAFQSSLPDPTWLPGQEDCFTWAGLDGLQWGKIAVDDVVIGVDKNGKGVEVEVRGYRLVLDRA